MTDGRTHHEGCWYHHHDCAIQRIEERAADVGRLQAYRDHWLTRAGDHAAQLGLVESERDALRAITDELEHANLDGAEDYVRLVSDLRRRIQEMRS